MIIKQISVFIENKSGRLANVTSVLKDEGINILAMSVADTSNFGILRMIFFDYEKAEQILKDNGFTVKATDVLAVNVPNIPGGLHKVIEVLTDKNIPVDYVYPFTGIKEGRAYVIVKTDNNEEASRLLSEANIPLMGYDELEKL